MQRKTDDLASTEMVAVQREQSTRLSRLKRLENAMQPGTTLDSRWMILRVIGIGGFAITYECSDTQTFSRLAVKVEATALTGQDDIERQVYRAMKHSHHCPKLYSFGIYCGYPFTVLQMLGPTLSVLRRRQPKFKFSFDTGLRCVSQAIQALQDLHKAGFIHRDVKPGNMAPGTTTTTRKTIYLFDFGLSKRYITAAGQHIQPKGKVGFKGTKRYASLNAHAGNEQSRMDDMCSVFYTCIELLKGYLPWYASNYTYSEVRQLKYKIQLETLCDGLPTKVLSLGRMIFDLKFDEKPQYENMHNIIGATLQEVNGRVDGLFDWEVDDPRLNARFKSVRLNDSVHV